MKTPTKTLKAKFNAAFSLVELLVVIAVIAIIAAVAIPNIAGINKSAKDSRWSHDKAEATRMVANAVAAGAPSTTGIGDILNTTLSVTNGTNVMTFSVQSDYTADQLNATTPPAE